MLASIASTMNVQCYAQYNLKHRRVRFNIVSLVSSSPKTQNISGVFVYICSDSTFHVYLGSLSIEPEGRFPNRKSTTNVATVIKHNTKVQVSSPTECRRFILLLNVNTPRDTRECQNSIGSSRSSSMRRRIRTSASSRRRVVLVTRVRRPRRCSGFGGF